MDQQSVPPGASSDKIKQFPAAASNSARAANQRISIKSLPLSRDERFVLTAYFRKQRIEEALEVCDQLGITSDPVYKDSDRLNAGVGQILVHDIQDRLPQWSATYNDGRIVFGREIRRDPNSRRLAFIAQYLFMINWADSGPGFSWPEAYNLFYVPGFERWVVTASQDSPDCWGWTDQAIGHFPGGTDRLEGTRRVIRRYWRRQENQCDAWESFWSEGLIDKKTALGWKNRIWPKTPRW